MLSRRSLLVSLAACAATAIAVPLVLSRAPVRAQASPPRLAIGGYDPVAYFVSGKPVLGSPQFVADWDGTRYQFASAANRAAFVATPDRYAPQFSGYCAGNMAQGRLAEPNPQNWVISNGRLYVFASAEGPARFKGPEGPNLIRRAEGNWQTVKR